MILLAANSGCHKTVDQIPLFNRAGSRHFFDIRKASRLSGSLIPLLAGIWIGDFSAEGSKPFDFLVVMDMMIRHF